MLLIKKMKNKYLMIIAMIIIAVIPIIAKAQYDKTIPWHPLVQISGDQGVTSVDANDDGIIDKSFNASACGLDGICDANHIITTGNIGVKTKNPTAQLDVLGNIMINTTTGNGNRLYLRSDGNTNWAINNINGDFRIFREGDNQPLTIESTTPTNTLYLDNTGNIGVGTNNPSGYKLYANGQSYFADDITGTEGFSMDNDATDAYDDGTSNAPYSRINADSYHTNELGTGQIYIEGSAIDANTNIKIGQGNAGSQTTQDIVLGDNNEIYVDTSTNRVGIGTNTPTAALHITGTTIDGTPNTEGIQAAMTSGNYAAIDMTGTNGAYIDFQNDISGTDYDMRITVEEDDKMRIAGGDLEIQGNMNVTTGKDICITEGNCLKEFGKNASRASAYLGSDTSFSNGADTQVTLNLEEYDNLNEFNNNQFTASEEGYYILSGSIRANLATPTILILSIKINGNVAAWQRDAAYYNIDHAINIEKTVHLNEGDNVTLWAYPYSGSAATVRGGSDNTYLQAYKIDIVGAGSQGQYDIIQSCTTYENTGSPGVTVTCPLNTYMTGGSMRCEGCLGGTYYKYQTASYPNGNGWYGYCQPSISCTTRVWVTCCS